MTHPDPLDDLGEGLAHSYRTMIDTPSGRAKFTTRAHFLGMCEATHRLGWGMTPTHVWTIVQTATDAAGPVPAGHHGSRNGMAPVRTYWANLARSIADGLKDA